MDVINSSLDSLKEKIIIVLKNNDDNKQKIQVLEKKNSELINLVNNLENHIKETEKENIALKFNKSLEKISDSGELKKKINEMVREIDKSIAYLNK